MKRAGKEQQVEGGPVARTFKSEQDAEAERRVASMLAKAWRCEVRDTGPYDPVDWHFVRDGSTVAVGEFKSRSHASTTFPTIFLSVRKWASLRTASLGLGVNAYFIVEFTDCIMYMNIMDADQSNPKMAGRPPREGSANDQELMIDVPISVLTRFARSPQENELATAG